jgi:hypothetical protein
LGEVGGIRFPQFQNEAISIGALASNFHQLSDRVNRRIDMKPYPTDIRLELYHRFPKLTQPLWTYLTAITPPNTPRKLRWTQKRHVAVWLLVYLASTAVGIGSFSVLIDTAAHAIGV